MGEDARVVCGQAVVPATQHPVGTTGDQSVCRCVTGAQGFPHDGDNAAISLSGEFACTPQQLERHRQHGSRRVRLGKDPDVSIGGQIDVRSRFITLD